MVKINNNKSNNENDWRFMGQDKYLMEKELIYHKYHVSKPNWEHDHCAFCGVKFSEQEGDLHEGYSTKDDYHWICKDCFNDFKEMFRWSVKNRHGDGSSPQAHSSDFS